VKDLSVESIRRKIAANLRNRRASAGDEPRPLSGAVPSAADPRQPEEMPSPKRLSSFEAFLWNFGSRHAAAVKKMPVIKDLAEKYYWKLSVKQMHKMHKEKRMTQQHPEDRDLDFAGRHLNYEPFLKEVRREGVKGWIKAAIYKVIGFFGWWQAQINIAFHREIDGLKRKVSGWERAIGDLSAGLQAREQAVRELATRLSSREREMEELSRRLGVVSRSGDALYNEVSEIRHVLAAKDREVRELNDRIGATSRNGDALYNEVSEIRQVLAAKDREVLELNDRIGDAIAGLTTKTEKIEEDGVRIQDLLRELAFVRRRMDMLNYELKKRTGISADQTVKELADKHSLAENYIYFAFENTFRGSRELIRERQSQYLGYVREAYARVKTGYVLDIGCGRGEFLELLSASGIAGKGVDVNDEFAGFCRGNGLDAEKSDALDFLVSVQDGSLAAVTAFQVVEHLGTDYLIELINASFQKIRPGGVVILETVNPFSLYAMRNYYADLTHRNPVPPGTLKFLLETAGFVEAEIIYSSPVPDAVKLSGSDENTAKLNSFLFGFQDYAVMGRKLG